MDESTFRMLLNLEVSAVGRSVLFNVASDLQGLIGRTQSYEQAQVLAARADLAASEATQLSNAAHRGLTTTLSHEVDMAIARRDVAIEAEAAIAASTTASAAQQELATQRVIAAQDVEAAARARLADVAVLEAEQKARADLASAAIAEQAAAKQVAAADAQAASLRSLGLIAAAGAVVLVGAIADTVSQAAKFQTVLLQVEGNTGATTAVISKLHDTILQLGADTGQATDELANGFRRAYDLSQNAAAANAILAAANKDAIGTGAELTTVANALAQSMHVYGLDVSHAASESERLAEVQRNATATMGLLQTAANNSNLTLEQFSKSFAIVASWASSVGVPMNEAAAAFSSLTKGTGNAARAGTQVIDMFQHIINPTRAASKEIERISRLSGVDLISDFSTLGLSTRHITGVMDDLRQAFSNMGLSEEEQNGEVLKLIPNLRGGVGAFLLLNKVNEDYITTLEAGNNALNNASVVELQYQRVMASTAQQFEVLKGSTHQLVVELGEALTPAADKALQAIIPMVKHTTDWIQANKDAVASAAPLAAELLAAAAAAAIFGGVMAVAAIPAIAAVTSVALPIAAVTFAIEALAIAWSRDWLHIRETVKPAAKEILDVLKPVTDEVDHLTTALGGTSKTAKSVSIAAGALDKVGESAANAGVATADFGLKLDKVGWEFKSLASPMSEVSGMIRDFAQAAAYAGDVAMSTAEQINALGSSVTGLAEQFGGTGGLVDSWVATTPAMQDLNAGLSAAQDHLNGLREAEANASSAGSGTSAALKSMQRESKTLADEISKANSALRDLASPNLPGMQAADDKIFSMGQKLKKLEDTKITMQMGGVKDNSAAMKAIDAQITREQQLIQLAENHKSLKYDADLKKITEAVEGTKKVMTFTDVIAQIKETKTHLAEWTKQQEALQTSIEDTQAAQSAGGSVRSAYSKDIHDAEAAVKDWGDRVKTANAELEKNANWLAIVSPDLQAHGGIIAQFAKQVDEAIVKENKDLLFAALYPSLIADATVAQDMIDVKLLQGKIAYMLTHQGQLPPDNPLNAGGDNPGRGAVNPYRLTAADRTAAAASTVAGSSPTSATGGVGYNAVKVDVHPGAIHVSGADGATNADVHDAFQQVFADLDTSLSAAFRNQNVRKKTLAGAN